MTKRKSKTAGKLDLRAALRAPLRVKQDGTTRSIDPYEAILRQHAKKSLIGSKIASIKYLIGEAEKHKLIEPPPPALTGGVYVVPKGLPEDVEREIFDHQPEPGTLDPMSRITGILQRFFNNLKGGRDAAD